MKISHRGIKHLTELEGCELRKYKDAAGYYTIGIGHLITRLERETGVIRIDGVDHSIDEILTEEQAIKLLHQDLISSERAVNTYVTAELTQNQYDALVSFVFNVGVRAFSESTLLRVLNRHRHNQVPRQLRRWNKAGGRIIKGLKNRREKEIALWRGIE